MSVWSNSHNRWFHDGRIVDVLPDSVRVVYEADKSTKHLSFQEAERCLKKRERKEEPSKDLERAGSKSHDHCGTLRKQIWNSSITLMRRACRDGKACCGRTPEHVDQFVHPGDRNYRHGLVVFKEGQAPEHETIWQLFNFYDREESGNLSKTQFASVLQNICCILGKTIGDADCMWSAAGGGPDSNISFESFVKWAEPLGLGLPIGLDALCQKRPCLFSLRDCRCGCVGFVVSEGGFLCQCGHKPSLHRTDCADRTSIRLLTPCPTWVPNRSGIITIRDAGLQKKFQLLLQSAHKSTDNWTRDRGCTIHGVGSPDCTLSCAMVNRVPVPVGYELVRVYRNQNLQLWHKYCIARLAIAEECSKHGSIYEDVPAGITIDVDAPLMPGCNEWRLFHGTSLEACKGVCKSNFLLKLAGGGATWKAPGETTGVSLYGSGVYMSEYLTKADEYSPAAPKTELPPDIGSEEIYGTIIVRCVGGLTRVVTTKRN